MMIKGSVGFGWFFFFYSILCNYVYQIHYQNLPIKTGAEAERTQEEAKEPTDFSSDCEEIAFILKYVKRNNI